MFLFLSRGWIDAWIFSVILAVTAVSLVVNIVSDYGSLFFVRAWLGRAAVRPVATLFVAALIGTLIVAATLLLRLVLAGLVQMMPSQFSRHVLVTAADVSPHMLWEAYLPALLFFPGIVVFAWFPLLGAGMILLRMINPLLAAVRGAQWFLKDGKDHPLDAVGCIAALIVFGSVAAWQVFFRSTS
jgi:hypothetical protein